MTTTERLIRLQPDCTYCGGRSPSTSRDHAPPITIFNLRDRPRGLEFGACDECHHGTREMDLIASIVSRMFPPAKDDAHRAELADLMRQFVRRFPHLAAELRNNRPLRQEDKVVGYAVQVADGYLTRVMDAFAARMGMALYREVTGHVLPKEGGVGVLWFSNVDAWKGNLPHEMTALMGAVETLRAGRKEVGEQFTYQHFTTEDGKATALYMTFRFSFAFIVLGMESPDMVANWEHPDQLFRPGFLRSWKAPTGRGPSLKLLQDAAIRAGLTIGRGV